MKRDSEFTKDSELASVRLPKNLKTAAKKYGRENDISFSHIMRRALRKELGWKEDELAALQSEK